MPLPDNAIVGRIIAFMAGAEAEVEIVGNCQGGDDDDRLQIARMMEMRLGEVGARKVPSARLDLSNTGRCGMILGSCTSQFSISAEP
jgi:hypothetical protein